MDENGKAPEQQNDDQPFKRTKPTPPPSQLRSWHRGAYNDDPNLGKRRGKWSAEEKGQMREAAQFLLSAKVPPGTEAYDLLQQMGWIEPTGAAVLMLAQFDQALKGSVEAAKFIRDTAGEKPEMVVSLPTYDDKATPDMLRGMTDAQLQEWASQRVVETEATEDDGT